MRDSCEADSVDRPVRFFSVHSVYETGHSYAASIIILPFAFEFRCFVIPFIVEYFPNDFVCDIVIFREITYKKTLLTRVRDLYTVCMFIYISFAQIMAHVLKYS